MLLYKKFIHLQLILVVKNKKMFLYEFYNVFNKNKPVYFLYYLQVLYSSTLKTLCQFIVLAKIPSKTVLNFFLLNFFSKLNTIYFITNVFLVNVFKKIKSFTVLRSPFVDKISREQLCINSFKGILKFNLANSNYLFVEFMYCFLTRYSAVFKSIFSLSYVKRFFYC